MRQSKAKIKGCSGTNLLHYTATIHLAGQCHNMTFHLVGQASFLGLIAVLKELLYHIITKYISHQLHCVRHQLSIDLVFLIAIGCFKLSLNETSTILIAAEFHNMMVDVLWPISKCATSV